MCYSGTGWRNPLLHPHVTFSHRDGIYVVNDMFILMSALGGIFGYHDVD